MTVRRKGAILVSGRGSNMQALLKAASAPGYPVAFTLIVSDRKDAAALATAAALGIPARHLTAELGKEGTRAFERELDARLRTAGIELVCLAGFMRILSPWLVSRWRGQILNVHPSLLPRYPGLDTHARAIANGDRESGCSVHVVTETLDGGPVLGQLKVPVLPEDSPGTLAARVLEAEHRLYPAVVACFADTRLPAP